MNILSTAATWTQPMAPADYIEYVAEFRGTAPLLEVGEDIATFTVALPPEAIPLGILIDITERIPILIDNNSSIQIWVKVEDDKQDLIDFSGAGVSIGIVFTIITTAVPPRTRQRTWILTVARQ